MNLFKTSILTAVSTFLKLVSNFLVSKFLAVYVGPSGLTSVGQLQNFIAISTAVANGSITTGVTKYVAEDEDALRRQRVYQTSLILIGLFSFVVSLLIIIFSDLIAEFLFSNSSYNNILKIFGFTVVFSALNTTVLSIFNGRGEIKKFIVINIFGSMVSLALSIFLIYMYNLKGALTALVLNQAFLFSVTFVFLLKTNWFSQVFRFNLICKETAKKLLGYSGVAFISLVCIQITQLVIRNWISSYTDYHSAGLWQAMLMISNMYMLLISSILSVYFIPKISNEKDSGKIIGEVKNGLFFLVPCVFLIFLIIFLLREQILLVVLSDDFLEIKDLIFWQLSSDLLRTIAMLFSCLILAKGKVKFALFSELSYVTTYLVLSNILISKSGVFGALLSNFFAYGCYLVVNLIFFYLVFIKNKNRRYE
ncbi:O-antigen translocase [Vibrio sp. PNB22_8_1]|uniref:O-antigen translocase n=1 Tax=unclassified Vibrio TaxID=2614977 RepID=UPI00406A2991